MVTGQYPRQYPPGQYPPSISPLDNVLLDNKPPGVTSRIPESTFRLIEVKPSQSNQMINDCIFQNFLNINSIFIREISFFTILKL